MTVVGVVRSERATRLRRGGVGIAVDKITTWHLLCLTSEDKRNTVALPGSHHGEVFCFSSASSYLSVTLIPSNFYFKDPGTGIQVSIFNLTNFGGPSAYSS